MDLKIINKELIQSLHAQAAKSERLRINYDLRTSEKDNSQRMLNVLQPGTKVLIHKHDNTEETILCLEGKLDVVFYAEVPHMKGGKSRMDFSEIGRTELCPRNGKYGVQVPTGMWHTIEVYEESTIFDGMNGAYGK